MTKNLPEFDLESYIPYQFSVIAAALSAALEAQYRERFGITAAEWRVLVNLAYSDSRSVRDIQWRVSLDKPKVSRAVARLEAAGYLTKEADAGDKRLLHLELTPKGIDVVAKLVPIAKRFQDDLERKLGTSYPDFQKAIDRLMPRPGAV